ncbi:hypothetical protein AMS64_22015 [Aeromonas veronii]|uniref:Cro/CI family transcriptional regulator n=1 Tax=Aeromonas veronii TaxID=654 RepID=UPI00078B7AEB|nr:Cro/CI family transcriptional regulator [Aeromonas veronii]AMQ44837.1 hypothetical protein AMS64_22015 [Aeromonas veronii]MCX0428010.1 Cro/CI family transcriptional regulator [Aeromonas veronii]MCX0447297.1 Cro/CI family transcriptional regulator [Aeromonas veronii]POG17275.1 Cro/Cl family transcriptional regulator [Aeromonas veronii]
MKKQDAIDRFGSVRALAAALGCSTQAISQWGEDVPPLRAFQLKEMTGGNQKEGKQQPEQVGRHE